MNIFQRLKVLTNFESVSISLFETLKLLIDVFNSTNNFKVKSDEENLNILLEKPEDKIKFEKAVEELKKDLTKPQMIELSNGKQIEIFN